MSLDKDAKQKHGVRDLAAVADSLRPIPGFTGFCESPSEADPPEVIHVVDDALNPNLNNPYIHWDKHESIVEELKSRLAEVRDVQDSLVVETQIFKDYVNRYEITIHELKSQLAELKAENATLKGVLDPLCARLNIKFYGEVLSTVSAVQVELAELRTAAWTVIHAEAHYEGQFNMRPYFDALKQALKQKQPE